MIISAKISPLLFVFLLLAGCGQDRVDFSSEVKPILNKRCISCHGGVKKNGGFSVLFQEEALDTTESGKHAIVPGNASKSEMIRRLTLTDPEERMPYKEEPLTKSEIDILTRWVNEGAEWGDHWAYSKPVAVPVPKSSTVLSSLGDTETAWPKNDIDHFVLEKITDHGLQPSAMADRATLIRRVYLDLTGLPPTVAQADKFVNDPDPNAYEKVVDNLLQSPAYGEKWASWWLDLARYSDTKGYERDVTRTIWRYRDWVIRAFNEDKPFDQFTIEQLAGDLLEDPTDDQLIATAFHRNTMNNDEGGTEDEEFRVASVIDRVNTTWEVWQSTTMGCVQCHSHPYDPFRHEEYYKALAVFNNSRDEDTEGEHPNLRMYEAKDQAKLEEIKAWIKNYDPAREREIAWFLKTLEPKYHPHDFDLFVNGELIDTKWLGIRPGGSARLKQIDLGGKTNLIINYWMDNPAGGFEIRLDRPDGELIAKVALERTGWDRKAIRIPLRPTQGLHDLYFVFPKNPRIPPQNSVCGIEWFAFRSDLAPASVKSATAMESKFMELLNAEVQNTPVMVENLPPQKRVTRVFDRGNWLTQSTAVAPGIPAIFGQTNESIGNRLDFARWLVSRENPLTSRTIVNRIWEQVFGNGLVETIEDFGTQGARPTHPELLDWLAVRLMNDHGWSLKKLLRDIVTSATYQQDSRVTAMHLEKDPSNQFLSRAPRVRLTAEQVRDQALAVSGLLSSKMYGESVMPYQPEGIWQSVWNGEYWKDSKGEDRYRRSLYTFIKRTSPYPAFMMFDGSSREICLSRRIRTNTPLQALVTLNDPTYLEASRSLARSVIGRKGTVPEQISYAYTAVTLRPIAKNKLSILNNLYDEALKEYSGADSARFKLMSDINAAPEAAAMTVVSNALLNLDEVMTRE